MTTATKRDNRTNTEFLYDVMEFSKSGPIMQMFIFDALSKVSARISRTPIEDLREAFGEDSFVNADAWHAAATELKQLLDERLKS